MLRARNGIAVRGAPLRAPEVRAHGCFAGAQRAPLDKVIVEVVADRDLELEFKVDDAANLRLSFSRGLIGVLFVANLRLSWLRDPILHRIDVCPPPEQYKRKKACKSTRRMRVIKGQTQFRCLHDDRLSAGETSQPRARAGSVGARAPHRSTK